jgi:hypothetical protein
LIRGVVFFVFPRFTANPIKVAPPENGELVSIFGIRFAADRHRLKRLPVNCDPDSTIHTVFSLNIDIRSDILSGCDDGCTFFCFRQIQVIKTHGIFQF